MVNHESDVSDYRPRRVPAFLREIESLSNDVGFINAVHQTLVHDNIDVRVSGDVERLSDHQRGILFVGDHKNQWEFVALMSLLSRMGREDMLNIAKFYVQRQVHQALGHTASQLVLPVYPRILARDRKKFFNAEMINRIVYRSHLLTLEESARANTTAIKTATAYLESGGIVNIFPTGSVVDARTSPWRTGVGRIIDGLHEDARQDVLIAPYAIDNISRFRLVGAVAMRGRGVIGRPQVINLRTGPLQTVAELVGSLPNSDHDNQEIITDRLRSQFVDHFH